MKIKICEANAAKINAALKAVNGKAAAHTIDDYRYVEGAAQSAEQMLDTIAKKDRVGVRVGFTPAGPSANSYKYQAISTRIRMVRGSSDWFLVDVERDSVNPKQPTQFDVVLTRKAEAAIVAAALRPFVTIRPRQVGLGDLVELDDKNRWRAGVTEPSCRKDRTLLAAV